MKKLLLLLIFCPVWLWGQHSVWLKGFLERQAANRPDLDVTFVSFSSAIPSPTSVIFTNRVSGTTFSPSLTIAQTNGRFLEWGFKVFVRKEDQVFFRGLAGDPFEAGSTVYRAFNSQLSYNYPLGIREKPLRFYLGWAFTFYHADLWFKAKSDGDLASRRRQSLGLNVGLVPRVQYFFNERWGIELNVFTEAFGLAHNTFQDAFPSFGAFRDNDVEVTALGHQHIQLGLMWRLMSED